MHKSGDLSKRLNVHANTIRNRTDDERFARFFSDGARGLAPGGKRRYTDHDALIHATIEHYQQQGFKVEQIVEALDTGRLVDMLPDLPSEAEQNARQNVALVPVAELKRALDQVQFLQSEMERLTIERDRALAARDDMATDLNRRIEELRAALGHAQGRLQALESERKPSDYWLRVVGVVVAVAALLLVALVLVMLSRGNF